MLINLSNHPHNQWTEEQHQAASQFGEVVDLPFPNVSPEATTEQLLPLIDEYYNRITQLGKQDAVVVHLMGEMTFTFMLVARLLNAGYRCVSSTTERIVKESTNAGGKTVFFQFTNFRDYKL